MIPGPGEIDSQCDRNPGVPVNLEERELSSVSLRCSPSGMSAAYYLHLAAASVTHFDKR